MAVWTVVKAVKGEWSSVSINNFLKSPCKVSGASSVLAHGLEHSFTTHFFEEGTALYINFLGYSSSKTTKTYTQGTKKTSRK